MIILRVTIDDNRGLIANLVSYVPSWFEINFFDRYDCMTPEG